MISSISIKNYALIKELNINLSPGLNIITGETGAGKSIIVDALSLLLGGRAVKSNIRSGEKKMIVSAQFDLSDTPGLIPRLEEEGVTIEDGSLILSREVGRNSKNVCRANGIIVPLALFKKLSLGLIDIHSQHEHVSLFQSENQRRLLDLYSGEEAISLLERIKNLTKDLKALALKIRELQKTGREVTRQQAIDQFEYDEISKLDLHDGEDKELEEEIKKLNKGEAIFSSSMRASELITNDEDQMSITDGLSSLSEILDDLTKEDDWFKSYSESVKEALSEISTFSYELTSYIDRLDYNPERLQEVNNRLYEIDELKQKYGDTIAEILDYQNTLLSRLETQENIDDVLKQSKHDYQKLREEYNHSAVELSSIRREFSQRLKEQLESELKELAMERARVEIQVLTDEDVISAHGQDEVSFLISVNPGVEPQELKRVASGGEMSRIMLALKGIFGEKDEVGTMIFDEIDTGISGRTAQVVAEKITKLSRKRQIICITHLPQIAAMADSQFLVEKLADDDLTEVSFHELGKEERAKELSRMLGGAEVTELTIKNAREMIEQASLLKSAEDSQQTFTMLEKK